MEGQLRIAYAGTKALVVIIIYSPRAGVSIKRDTALTLSRVSITAM